MAGMLDRITGALRRAVGRVTGGKRVEAKGQPVQVAGQPKGGAKGGAAAKPRAGTKGTPSRSRKK
jgi:uncharacterized protein YjbJ (UPF0337 family)